MRLAPLIPAAILAAAASPSAAPQTPSPSTVELTRPAPDTSPELASILERAGQYALEYQARFQDIAADEKYTQWTGRADTLPTVRTVVGSVPVAVPNTVCSEKGGNDALPYSCTRATKADVVFVRLGGAVPWGAFHDVYEVDGKMVRKREPRLERIFSSLPSADAEPQARGLTEDGDKRYNIGTALRDIDAPTLTLMFLHPKNQSRFAWKLGGKRRFKNVEAVELVFEEISQPTIVGRTNHQGLPASGRAWVDPAQGTLLRGETDFRFEGQARASVAIEYVLEPNLGIWVPGEVREEYDDLKGSEAPLFGAPRTRATSQFSNFRRLSMAAADQPPAKEPVLATYGAELTELLQHVGEYVADYERSFGDLLAEETYTQRLMTNGQRRETSTQTMAAPQGFGDSSLNDPSLVGQSRGDADYGCNGCRRTTRADLVFVRLAGEIPWASYRDVFEVNGHKVRAHEQRLVKLLSNPSADAQEQTRKVLAASAAYNIGPVKRTVNLPTLPLLFLLPRNQGRFEFQLGTRKMIRATEAIELVFKETSRPTLVKGPWNADLPAKGRFWINPTQGAVVRSEVEFAYGAEAQARVITDYRPEPTLAMWVPAEMREHFADVPNATVKTFPAPFNGEARYERFRRFTVATDEQIALPQP